MKGYYFSLVVSVLLFCLLGLLIGYFTESLGFITGHFTESLVCFLVLHWKVLYFTELAGMHTQLAETPYSDLFTSFKVALLYCGSSNLKCKQRQAKKLYIYSFARSKFFCTCVTVEGKTEALIRQTTGNQSAACRLFLTVKGPSPPIRVSSDHSSSPRPSRSLAQ